MSNSFGYENLEGDLAEVAETVQAARDAGAEIVICYYHWGEEYQRSPNEWQQLIAMESAVTMAYSIPWAISYRISEKKPCRIDIPSRVCWQALH